MSREIKFRGKRVDNGEEEYGDHFGTGRNSLELFWMNVADKIIDIETVVQFIGEKDKKGTEIWIGDIYRWYQPLVVNGKQTRKECISTVEDEIVELYYLHNRAENCWGGVEIIGDKPGLLK